MSETPRLILNYTSEPPRVLHREDCQTIQHQVRGDVREELPSRGFEILESYDDGLSLIGPAEGMYRSFYEARYVTLDELPFLGRYRRCRVCAPDAPEGPDPVPVYRKKAESLGATDIGRLTVDGVIERVVHSRSGTVVTLESGEVLSLAAGETVAFPKKPLPA
ncbi:hypothetical protein [Microbacterium foliorum]|uniref:hypothetical protein n=1 Tax=Microbacterium foliorum TaxID=104336 RepID=UPI0037366917